MSKEKKEKEMEDEAAETGEAMKYALKKKKAHGRLEWLKRRFAPGIAAAAIAFGAHKKYLHEPIKNTAEIVLYTADATRRLGSAAKRLGEEIVGSSDSESFDKAQREFEFADREYFESISDLLKAYKDNLDDRKNVIDEMKNAAEGFGRVAQKAPGYESLKKTGIPSLRERINGLMARYLGGQGEEVVKDRMSEEFAKNYNELLKMLNEADRKKSVGREEIQKIADRMAETVKSMGRVYDGDKKELEEKTKEVNELYSLSRKIKELETGQIRKKDRAYEQLKDMGRKYGLDSSRPENYANIIAYAAGVILAGLAYRLGSGLGGKVIPRRRFNVKNAARKYLEEKIEAEEKAKRGGELEKKIISILVILVPLFLFPFFFRITGFTVVRNLSASSAIMSNVFLFGWFFLLFFYFIVKIYK